MGPSHEGRCPDVLLKKVQDVVGGNTDEGRLFQSLPVRGMSLHRKECSKRVKGKQLASLREQSACK